jgi:hypothetical protein
MVVKSVFREGSFIAPGVKSPAVMLPWSSFIMNARLGIVDVVTLSERVTWG